MKREIIKTGLIATVTIIAGIILAITILKLGGKL